MIEPVPLRRIRWHFVFLPAAAISINYLDRSTTAIATLDIRRDFDINATQFGALQSASCFLFAMAQIPAGFLASRIGPRILISASLAFRSIAVAAGSFALTCSQLLIACAALGVTAAPAYPAAVRVTACWLITARWRRMSIIAGLMGMTASMI